MAVPKKRASKARTRRRYHANSVLKIPELYRSAPQGHLVRRHHIDVLSGEYRGNVVLQPTVDSTPKKGKK